VEDGGGTLRYTHGGMYGRVCGFIYANECMNVW